jgi:hypothetical protein
VGRCVGSDVLALLVGVDAPTDRRSATTDRENAANGPRVSRNRSARKEVRDATSRLISCVRACWLQGVPFERVEMSLNL